MIRGVRGIVKDGDKILLMKRVKKGRTYYVIPGGKIEEGEDEIEALTRELKEESDLDVEVGEQFWEHKKLRKKGWRLDKYYKIISFRGIPALGGPEAKRDKPDNHYELYWADIDELKTLAIRPIKLRYVIPEQFL